MIFDRAALLMIAPRAQVAREVVVYLLLLLSVFLLCGGIYRLRQIREELAAENETMLRKCQHLADSNATITSDLFRFEGVCGCWFQVHQRVITRGACSADCSWHQGTRDVCIEVLACHICSYTGDSGAS
jgi:hypothetical protein